MSNTELILVREKTGDVIRSAVNKLVDFVRPTYGPASNKVIISKNLYKMVVDDGVQIARDFELPDPAENAVVNVIREVAIKTNDRVGDGTTSSLIMLQGILNEIQRHGGTKSGRLIEKELRKALEEVKDQLKKASRTIKTKEELRKVAMVSFDDPKVSEMIADLYFKLGADATITIDKSPTMETSFEMSQGITINRGYISPYMITNPERMEAVFEKPHILITDYRITEANDLIPIMSKLAEKNIRDLVVIAENVEGAALATAVVNRLQGKFGLLAVSAPNDGDRKVFLEDVALMTGARMFSESKGDKLEEATIEDLGRATRFIARRSESVIIGGKAKKGDVEFAIKSLGEAIKGETDEKQKANLTKRLNTLNNKIAVIKVGAPTENEQRALKYKVEDAVNAVKAAFKGGVVCGSGLALARIKTSSPILNEALKYPARQLRANMGIDEVEMKDDEAMNVVTGKVGKFMEVGVMDPTDVLAAGVESAVSIATVLITSAGIIAEAPKKVEAPE